MANEIDIRDLLPSDSIPDLTRLLHAAYAELAAQGFNYTATDQSEDVTRKRVASGRCLVATVGGDVVGTALYKAPGLGKGTPHYETPGHASLHRFAVAPTWQRHGIGAALLAYVEGAARQDGAKALALDTSEGALKLIAWYGKHGFHLVEHAQWPGKSYRSVILSKSL